MRQLPLPLDSNWEAYWTTKLKPAISAKYVSMRGNYDTAIRKQFESEYGTLFEY